MLQGGGGLPPPARTSGLEALHELPGHRPDVRPPVALDLDDVAEAAHGEAVELAAEGVGDGAPDGGLAHPGRAHEAEDLPLGGPAELRDGDELQDALLHVLQAVVVRVKHLPQDRGRQAHEPGGRRTSRKTRLARGNYSSLRVSRHGHSLRSRARRGERNAGGAPPGPS